MTDTAAKKAVTPGVGLDVGTMNLVSAREEGGKTVTRPMRDAFLDLEPEAKRALKLSKVDYIEIDDQLVVIGDAALRMANLFKREARRPLSQGVISAGELDAQEILSILISQVVGKPVVDGEHCFYSVPAEPIDNPGQDIIYHTEVFRQILEDLGYTAHPTNEAMAIIFSQCADDQFSGLAVSYGAGMTNIALSYQASQALDFSLARCLSKDFVVLTHRGPKKISDVQAGEDRVLDGLGQYAPVLEVVDNGVRDTLKRVTLKGLTAFPLDMTGDHRVFAKSRFGWDWKDASSLSKGDILGIPTLQSTQDSGGSYYFGRKDGVDVKVATARNLGRFFGYFLGDGSCGPYSENPEFVQLAVNAKHSGTIEKYSEVLATLFGRFSESGSGFGVQVCTASNDGVARIKLHSTVVARHMKSFYEGGEKVLPLPLDKVSNQMALGILEGLFDSDGWSEPTRRCFGNTSVPLISLAHQLLNRFGIKHSISRRDPRTGGVNSRGVLTQGAKDEYNVRVVGHVSTNLLETLLSVEGHQVWDHFPDFAEFAVESVEDVPYGSSVYDLKVGSDHHSFSTFGALVHNCGDWVDQNSARAVGKTASQMCAIKEKGVNLSDPQGRDQQAIAMYVKNLISYSLKQISSEFKKVANEVQLDAPIPFVVSGGTSKAGGFMELFEQEFDKVKKKFPIQVSEVRHATDPLTAVAEGMLVLAQEEHEEEG